MSISESVMELYRPAFGNMAEANSIVSLGDNTGKIGQGGIDNHDPSSPRRIPEKEKRAAEPDRPVTDFRTAGFQIFDLRAADPPLKIPLRIFKKKRNDKLNRE